MIRTLEDIYGDNRRVIAKCCRRTTNACMVICLPNPDKAKMAQLGIKATELCDACRERLVREKKISRRELRNLLAGKVAIDPSG